MLCPKCHQPQSQVLDSREGPDSIRRRRECLACHYRFTTYERVELPTILVKKNNGNQEKFDPDKIYRGVRVSCKNRPVTSAQLDNLVNEVSQKIYFSGKTEISSRDIGNLVQDELKKIDQVAYLRFISVYQSFNKIEEFEKVIQKIIKETV
jgi:transcriptional repressor NrdR